MIEQHSTGSLRAFIYALLIHAALLAALAPDMFNKKPKPLPDGQRVRVAFMYAPSAQEGGSAVPKRATPALQKKPAAPAPEPKKPEPVKAPEPKPEPKKPEPVKAPEPKPEPKKPEPVKVPEPKPEPQKPEPVKVPEPKPEPKKPEPVNVPEPRPEPKKPEPVNVPEPKPEPKKPEPVKTPEPEDVTPPRPVPPLLRKPEPPAPPAPEPVKETPKEAPKATPPKPAPKKTDKAFDDLAKSLSQPAAKKPAAASDFDSIGDLLDGLDSGTSAARMSAGAVRDVIKSRVVPNWSVPMTAQGLAMTVRVSIRLNQDGSINGRPTALPSPQDGDPIYERLKISTLQAVERTAPFIGLPAPNYQGTDGWNHVELRFSPQDITR